MRFAILVLALTTAACGQSIKPIRDASTFETEYLKGLASHLSKEQKNYDETIGLLTTLDQKASASQFKRADARARVSGDYATLKRAGLADSDALRIAAMQQVEREVAIYEVLIAAEEEREAEQVTLHDLYATIAESVAAASKNQKVIDEYLNKNWLCRTVADVKGLDNDQLKELSKQLKTLNDRLKDQGGDE